MTAHAATSGVAGKYTGTIRFNNITSIMPEDSEHNFIAKIGNSIGNFLVSNAQAESASPVDATFNVSVS